MLPNSNVYGTQNEWHLANYDMPEAYLAAWGTDSITYGTLNSGVSENKISLKEPIDNSISYVGMGAESPYSNIISINSTGIKYIDNRAVTNFFYAYGTPITYDYYIPNDGNAKTWDVDTLANDNYNKDYRPIVSFNPKKLLWHVMVTVSDAQYNGTLYTTGLNTYNASAALQTQYPYLKMAFIYPLIDTSNTETPHWVNTLTEPMHLCLNERRYVENFNFITYNDLKIDSAYYRGGILLRGSIEGIGNSFISNDNCVYMLGDENSIVESSTGYYVYAELYNIAVCNEILKAAACFCNYFVGTNPWPVDWESTALNSDTVFLGYPDENGVSHGEYTIGAENENNPVWKWGQTCESTYDYKNVDNNTYSQKTTFNNVGNLASMLKRYVLTASGVEALGVDLWTICGDLAQTTSDLTFSEKCLDGFLTNNPINAIVKLERYPLKSIPYTGSLTNLKLGKYTASTGGYVMPYTTLTYDFKKINISPKFGNSFLDYNPYTVYQLYIPFCGTTDLNPSEFIGKTLSVRMIIDFTTGTCTAYILANGLAIKTLNGSCAIDVPVTGTESATVMANINNAMIQERTANANKVALIGGTASLKGLKDVLFNTVDYTKNVVNSKWAAAGAEYNLTHQQIPINTIGAATSAASWAIDLKCRLIIYYPTGEAIDSSGETPKLSDLTEYAHINGFATVENGQLNDYSGFTQCAGVDLSGVPATNDEKEMILTLLSSGIYI